MHRSRVGAVAAVIVEEAASFLCLARAVAPIVEVSNSLKVGVVCAPIGVPVVPAVIVCVLPTARIEIQTVRQQAAVRGAASDPEVSRPLVGSAPVCPAGCQRRQILVPETAVEAGHGATDPFASGCTFPESCLLSRKQQFAASAVVRDA